MTFSPEMYDQIREGCQRSAAAVVPVVWKIVRPSSVVDVGGGEGWWGREFAELGAVVDVLDETAEDTSQPVGQHGGWIQFHRKTLGRPLARPDNQYDLAVCLEVAEHLPEEQAHVLVESLVNLAPVVLFSAAIPGQGGHGHLNEQWPGYWYGFFARLGYTVADLLRREIWNDARVEPWYRQNLLFFARVGHPLLAGLRWDEMQALPLVHPTVYEWRIAERDEARSAAAEAS